MKYLSLVWDLLALAGGLLFSLGAYQAWAPLGLMVGGLSLLAVGLLGARHHVLDRRDG